jgi:uncharacterized damage-inducible protein DinB
MRRLSLLTACLALAVTAAPTLGQDPDPDAAWTAALAADLQRVGDRLGQLAEAVPADKYSWRPADGVRTVSEVYMHIAGANTLLPAGLGAAPPAGLTIPENPFDLATEWERNVTAKDDVVAKLKESFVYATQAAPTVQDLGAQVEPFGFPASKRTYLLILLTHAHEHLGQSIAYARSIGVTPPWSLPQPSEGEPAAE